MEQIINIVSDETKQRDLILEDEEEDFLDEGNNILLQRYYKIIWAIYEIQ